MPYWLSSYWNYIVTFFGLGTVTFLAGFGRNIYGYLRNFFKSHYKEEYDITKLVETLMLYGGIITTFGAIIPAPYDKIGMMLVVVGDFLYSEGKKILMAT